jgi:hypothetical protein
MQRNSRKEGTDVWQFRWSEAGSDGKRLTARRLSALSSNTLMRMLRGEP